MMADYAVVLNCWKNVEADYAGYGGEVLTRLFKKHPHLQNLFPELKSINPSDLPGNVKVATQGKIVLKKLGELLKAKEDLTAIRKELDTSHANMHKIDLNDFGLITEVLVKVMVEKADLDMAKQCALKRVMDCLIRIIGCYYKEIGFAG